MEAREEQRKYERTRRGYSQWTEAKIKACSDFIKPDRAGSEQESARYGQIEGVRRRKRDRERVRGRESERQV